MDKEDDNEQIKKDRNLKKQLITVGVSVLSVIFVCIVLLVIFRFNDDDAASPEISGGTQSAAGTYQAHTQAPAGSPAVPTEEPSSQPVLPHYMVFSGLEYQDGRRLMFNYSDQMITATDEQGNIVLSLQFDGEGHLIKRTEYDINRNVSKWEYYEDGRTKTYSSSIADLPLTVNYIYDAYGNFVKTESIYGMLTGNGTVSGDTENVLSDGTRIEYTYKDGIISEARYYENPDMKDALTRRSEFSYTEEGYLNKARSTFYSQDGSDSISVRDAEYDIYGRLIYNVTESGSHLVRTGNLYNERNSIEVSETYEENDNIKIWTYDFPQFEFSVDCSLCKYEPGSPYKFYKLDSSGGNYSITICYADREFTYPIGRISYEKRDDKNRIVERIYVADDGEKTDGHIEYDEKGRISRENLHYCDAGDDGNYYDLAYTYDDKGNIISVSSGRDDAVYTFDEGGRLVKYKGEYDDNGRADFTMDFTYHKNGEISDVYITFEYGGTARFEYDENGRRTGCSYMSTDSTGTVYRSFDSSGNLIREIYYSGDNGSDIESSADLSYDSYGRLSEKIEYKGDRQALVQRTVFRYAPSGLRTGWDRYDSEGKKMFTYNTKYAPEASQSGAPGADTHIQGAAQYDSNGNLIMLRTYDSLGNTIVGIFAEDTEAVFYIYQICSISDLIPELW